MSDLETARKLLGQLFIIGVNGLEVSDDTSAFLAQAGIGGVILHGTNYESPAQIAELCNQVQESREKAPLWICVDHEGGRGQRLKKPFTRIPDAQTIASKGSPKLAFEIAEVMARELRAVGINVNFAPVADIAIHPKNPVMGHRSFGTTEDEVSRFSTAIVRGHLVQGVQPCVKHFPGHGDTNVDSHLALPKVDTPLEVLRERELRPFSKAFKSHCSMVMTAHILNPKLDPQLPATLSPTILKDLLRKQMRYSRLIISDDLEMKAIADHFGAEDAPRLALQAGCDLLLYKTEAAARKAYEALTRNLESGKLEANTVLEAAYRTLGLKREALSNYQPVSIAEVGKIVGIPEHQAVIQRIEES